MGRRRRYDSASHRLRIKPRFVATADRARAPCVGFLFRCYADPYLGAETSDPCDDALIPLSVQFSTDGQATPKWPTANKFKPRSNTGTGLPQARNAGWLRKRLSLLRQVDELFERYQRSEKALVGSLAEMYVQGVSTRKVKAVTEALCGHSFSASSISAINKSLDESLQGVCRAAAGRELSLPDPRRALREGARGRGHRQSGGAGRGGGRRGWPAADPGGRAGQSREPIELARFSLSALKARGLAGVEFVVSDDHPGLKQAIREVLPEAAWQRCYVHFLRNALDYVPRKVDDDCLRELRWFYDRRDLTEVRRDIAAWLGKWQAKYPRLCNWVEDNIEETLTYYRLPLPHHKHMKSTNMLERLNQELKRRTHVVRIFPNAESCLRLVRALGGRDARELA